VSSRVVAVVGPTASGKSDLAVALARALGGEVVNADSMQLYAGMDIGTAKLTPTERRGVPHHLLDVWPVTEPASVAAYQVLARRTVDDLLARDRVPVVVGGSGLYVRAVLDDLRFPGEDLELRAELEVGTSEPGGVAAAYAELSELDPDAAARIDPHNARRIVRALEVIRLTGKPFSSFGSGVGSLGPTAFPVRMAGVWLPRAVLAGRIARRFAAMREAGLVDEVRRLAGSNGGLSRTAGQAIGYKELLAHFEGAEPSVDAALETATRRTRSFARRQRMWFRRDPRITWYGAGENPALVRPALLASWSR